MRSRELQEVFEAIHRNRSWGECESSSGPGSTRERVSSFLPDLIDLVKRLQISTLMDAPCGDFNWAEPLADAAELYIGVDIVPALVQANCRSHLTSRRQFLCRDMVRDVLPAADLIMCRDALVHLTTEDILATLENFRRTGAEYLILTTFLGEHQNEDIASGQWRPLNMERPPFSLPPPIKLVDERCPRMGAEDKRLGLWRLSDVSRQDLGVS